MSNIEDVPTGRAAIPARPTAPADGRAARAHGGAGRNPRAR